MILQTLFWILIKDQIKYWSHKLTQAVDKQCIIILTRLKLNFSISFTLALTFKNESKLSSITYWIRCIMYNLATDKRATDGFKS